MVCMSFLPLQAQVTFALSTADCVKIVCIIPEQKNAKYQLDVAWWITIRRRKLLVDAASVASMTSVYDLWCLPGILKAATVPSGNLIPCMVSTFIQVW